MAGFLHQKQAVKFALHHLPSSYSFVLEYKRRGIFLRLRNRYILWSPFPWLCQLDFYAHKLASGIEHRNNQKLVSPRLCRGILTACGSHTVIVWFTQGRGHACLSQWKKIFYIKCRPVRVSREIFFALIRPLFLDYSQHTVAFLV